MIEETAKESPVQNPNSADKNSSLSPSLRAAMVPGKQKGARELKFLVDEATAVALESRLSESMISDPHSVNGGYSVRSLYLDTPTLDVFHRRGMHAIHKLRIRQYGSMPSLFLERKSKRAGRVLKQRLEIPGEQLADALAGPEWFGEEIRKRHLGSVCLVGYERSAWIAADSDMRVTIDRSLRGRIATVFDLDLGAEAFPVHPGRCVVEFKFLENIPSLFKVWMSDFGLQAGGHSKYRGSMRALGLAHQIYPETA